MNQRIVLIHATPLAVEPVNQAFADQWPEAQISNLLDDALSVDRRKSAGLTDRLYQRIDSLVDYAASIDAAAVLFTCSAFGEAIDASAARHAIPVLKPNEAMFEAALAQGKNIVMLATFAPAVAGMEAEFNELARQGSHAATLRSIVVEGAREALEQGDTERHNQLIVQAAREHGDADAILLAHFSMSIAWEQVQRAVSCPVLSSPHAAVSKLKLLMTH
ncbi:aspartate/glutamate racemase family protein [Dryocola sp. BD613]|uniref:aspartate/glutamate racemase family protein n=1 Tax=Dryocola sp. BD613 TaxID=3133272 RepID=UPI003F4FE0CE